MMRLLDTDYSSPSQKLPPKTTYIILLVLLSMLVSTTLSECTPDACLYCDNDGSIAYCSTCGNGLLLEGKGTKRRCKGEIKIDNCYEAEPDDPKQCMTCRRHYYLTSKKHCKRLTISGCLLGTQINGQIYCSLCSYGNLSEDFKSCITEAVPDNCISGNMGGKNCVLCEPGFYAESFTNKCKKVSMTGCGIYDSKMNCLECNTFHGYYGVDSIDVNGLVYQTECQFYTNKWSVSYLTVVILIFSLISG